MKKTKARAKLEGRIARYEKAEKNGPKTDLHKPGSQNRHKQ